MPELLPDQLRLMAEHHPDEIAFTDVSTGIDLTFAEWEARSNQLARWLVANEVAKGDRVVVHVPPQEPDRFLVAYTAVHKAGAVAVPTSTRLVARELVFVVDHAGAAVAITGTSTLPALVEAATDLTGLRTVVTTAPAEDWPDGTDVRSAALPWHPPPSTPSVAACPRRWCRTPGG